MFKVGLNTGTRITPANTTENQETPVQQKAEEQTNVPMRII
jgi:hypothetical protein